ncbi:hypothetical protein NOF04DRAFT_22207 [Fusarium oxysporum II5]|uniref:Phytanoyl-CoA dioxygenase n=2 Tax=Fusarium oxysporum species complex TaxID=171631 RepID=X0K1V3_FUSO5|nr:uncharacterized protein FOIG_06771 [Fusarium odoratissimum NRRL 54006]EXM02621.1 hypothetical protein FOIG_06771 [Fusarium odoratissimum NRRL 54006]KAK2133515.1 hypothetical protein NOF04DRAFT_22207 [Fusarium oxysporum II5]TXC06959.1 hypothetical protein FocTR4_00003711 [Fusarium oxysporum f. sp. cubense]
MSSASALGYFLSLKRCELSEVNNELDRRFLSQVQISEFKKDGVLVVDDVFNPLEISNALLAFHCIESLMKNETVSHADINLEALGGGKIRKIMNLIDHGDGFKALAIHPSLLVLITGLLGPKFRLHSKGFLTNKPPEVSSIKPWHQDSAYFSAGNTVITV